jgi:carboxylate-amine ligase
MFEHQAWTIRENKWRAARHGLEAEIIRDEEGNVMSLRRSISDIVDRLAPTAERLGCLKELRGIDDILERGTSSTRQREVYRETGDLSRVVDHLVHELQSGKPRPLGDDDMIGGVPDSGDRLPGESGSRST